MSSSSDSNSSSSHNQQQRVDYYSKGYKDGMIARVFMKNFLTFDEAECFPGPYVNVIIGPNGSGKSSITHAICLACNGGTKDVGRARNLNSFRKKFKEHEDCFVEVDIVVSEKKALTIRRVLTENNSSVFYLDGEKTTHKNIDAIMKKYSIDVDNLCTFMPQDRVGEFSRLTPTQLLVSTLKSIKRTKLADESIDLLEEQRILANFEKTKTEMEQSIKAKVYENDKVEQKLRELQPEVDRLHERERLLQQQRLLSIAVLIASKSKIEKSLKLLHNRKVGINKELDQQSAIMIPLEAKRNALRQSFETTCNQQNDLQSSILVSVNDINNCGLSMLNLDEAITDIVTELKNREDAIVSKQQRLVRLEEKYRNKREELRNINLNISQFSRTKNDLTNEICNLNDEETKKHLELRERQSSLSRLRMHVSYYLRQLQQSQTPREIYKAKLRHRVKNSNGGQNNMLEMCLKTMEWLDENVENWKQEGKLENDIYYPACSYITTRCVVTATILNKAIPANMLFGLIALSNKDASWLKQKLHVDKKWNINIYTMTNGDPNHPQFIDRRVLSDTVLSQTRVGYLANSITCPDVIRAFLYSFCNLQCVLYGTSIKEWDTDLLQDLTNESNTRVRVYLHVTNNAKGYESQPYPGEILEYVAIKSRYALTEAPSTRVQSVTYYPFNVINVASSSSGSSILGGSGCINGIDKEVEFHNDPNELQKNVNSLEKQIVDEQLSIENIQATIHTIQTQLKAVYTQKNELKSLCDASRSIQVEIDSIYQQIQMLRHELTPFARMQAVAEQRSTYAQRINEMLVKIKQMAKLTSEYFVDRSLLSIIKQIGKDIETRFDDLTLLWKNEQHKLRKLKDQLSQLDNEIKDLTNASESSEDAMLSLVKDELGGEIMFLSEGGGYEAMSNLIAPMERQYHEQYPQPPITHTNLEAEETDAYKYWSIEAITQFLSDLDYKILAIQTRLDLHFQENSKAIEQYYELKHTFELQESELKKERMIYATFETTYSKRLVGWITEVQQQVNRLDSAFHQFMEKLGFDGGVRLSDGSPEQHEDLIDKTSSSTQNVVSSSQILNIAMHIYVSFRKNSKLVPLNGFLQSGGERAVSTIMFLMALLSMNSSPFRVVDEINQGMDDINERRVMDLLIKSCLPPLNKNSAKGEWLQSRNKTTEHYPQFFLITPKLLPALISLRDPRVTVMVLWNSEGSKGKFTVPDLISTLKQTPPIIQEVSQSSDNKGEQRSQNEKSGTARVATIERPLLTQLHEVTLPRQPVTVAKEMLSIMPSLVNDAHTEVANQHNKNVSIAQNPFLARLEDNRPAALATTTAIKSDVRILESYSDEFDDSIEDVPVSVSVTIDSAKNYKNNVNLEKSVNHSDPSLIISQSSLKRQPSKAVDHTSMKDPTAVSKKPQAAAVSDSTVFGQLKPRQALQASPVESVSNIAQSSPTAVFSPVSMNIAPSVDFKTSIHSNNIITASKAISKPPLLVNSQHGISTKQRHHAAIAMKDDAVQERVVTYHVPEVSVMRSSSPLIQSYSTEFDDAISEFDEHSVDRFTLGTAPTVNNKPHDNIEQPAILAAPFDVSHSSSLFKRPHSLLADPIPIKTESLVSKKARNTPSQSSSFPSAVFGQLTPKQEINACPVESTIATPRNSSNKAIANNNAQPTSGKSIQSSVPKNRVSKVKQEGSSAQKKQATPCVPFGSLGLFNSSYSQ